MSESTSVALVGRNTIVREGLQRILSDYGFKIIASAPRPASFESALEDGAFILILLVDDDAREFDATSLCSLRERFPQARIVLLANSFDFGMVRRAFEAGAAGYLVDEIACDRLIGLLKLVAMGEKVFPSQLARELVDQVAVPHHSAAAPTVHSANLSGREVEILRCLIMGLPNKVISRRLTISEATVKVHVKAILRKLHVMNRTQAAIWATSRGLRGFDCDEPLAPEAVQAALAASAGLESGFAADARPLHTA